MAGEIRIEDRERIGLAEAAAAGLVIAFALFARLFDLGGHSLWWDELYTVMTTRLDWDVLLTEPFDAHPPLYNALVKLAAGESESVWAIRSVSVLAGVAGVSVIWILARRLFGPETGFIALLFAASSTFLIQHGQDARSYALLCLFVGLAALCAAYFLTADDRKAGALRLALLASAGYGLFALGAMYTHWISALYLFALNAMVVLSLILRDGSAPVRLLKRSAPWLAANVIVAAILLPMALNLGRYEASFQWLVQPDVKSALREYLRAVGGTRLPTAANLVYLALCLSGAMIALRRGRHAGLLICAGLAFLAPALIWTVGFIKPLYMQRLLTPALIGAAPFMALAVASLPWRWVKGGLVALLISPVVFHHFLKSSDFRTFEAQRETVALVDARRGPNDVLIACRPVTYAGFDLYSIRSDTASADFIWPNSMERFAWFEGEDRFAPASTEAVAALIRADMEHLETEDFDTILNAADIGPMRTWAEMTALLQEADAAWLLFSHCTLDQKRRLSDLPVSAGLTESLEFETKRAPVARFSRPR